MTPPVLFYDGECGLCDRTVRWCLRHDRRGVLRFAPLQGSTFAALTRPDKPVAMESLVLIDGDGLHLRSEAVLRVLRQLGGIWVPLGALGRLVPQPLREAGYRLVARYRSRWFGGAERCRLTTLGERSRLLP